MTKIAILVGSVYGAAEELAEHAQAELMAKGLEALLFNDASLADVLAIQADTWLVITSTTGQGDVPDNLMDVYTQMRTQSPNLSQHQYGVIAMGDSSYHDSFCSAGKQFDQLLQEQMAKPLQSRLEIDACVTMDPLSYAKNWLDDFIARLA